MLRILRRDNFTFAIGNVLCLLLIASTEVSAAQQPSARPQEQAAVDSGKQATPPSQIEPPAYKLLRYEEDYSYLSDPSRRTDFWDPIKYIPLGNLKGWYLSLGGEVRERYEFFHNEEAGGQPADRHGNNNYALQRYLFHGDLHLGSHIRFFAQFISGLENERIGGPRPDIDRDIFDIHQAFVDVVLPISPSDSLTARLGRQELRYGSGRLVDVREAPNLRRSFDAARLLLRPGEWSVEGFWSKPVRNRVDEFDDDSDPQRSLWGVYGVHPFVLLPQGHADLYYLGYKNRIATFDQGSGREQRHSLGIRLWGQPFPWEYDVELIWQFGTFKSGTIHGWGIGSTTHYNLISLPFRPRLGARADITSGDRNPNSANLQTFNPLFPTGAYYNLMNPAGPQNFIHIIHPALDLQFGSNVMLRQTGVSSGGKALRMGFIDCPAVYYEPGNRVGHAMWAAHPR